MVRNWIQKSFKIILESVHWCCLLLLNLVNVKLLKQIVMSNRVDDMLKKISYFKSKTNNIVFIF